MNSVNLLGRLVQDPRISQTQGNEPMTIARFTLAVDRPVRRNQDQNQQTADFISCTAFGKTAETIEKYIHKGSQAAVTGRIQTGSYTNKDGQKVYTTDVIVDRFFFCGSKSNNETVAKPQPKAPIPQDMQQFVNSTVDNPSNAEELPWN